MNNTLHLNLSLTNFEDHSPGRMLLIYGDTTSTAVEFLIDHPKLSYHALGNTRDFYITKDITGPYTCISISMVNRSLFKVILQNDADGVVLTTSNIKIFKVGYNYKFTHEKYIKPADYNAV